MTMERMTRTAPHTSQKTLFVDVMLHEKFVFTLKYKFCPLFKLKIEDIVEKVFEARPSLKGKPIELYID